VPTKESAVTMIIVLVVPLMLLSGFFSNQADMLPVLVPFKYVSPFKWGFQVYALNEYRDLKLS